MPIRLSALTGLALLALAPTLAAATAVLSDEGYTTFLQSELENLALSSHGSLESAPGLTRLAELPGDRVWDAVRADDGRIYAAVGDKGEVYRIGTDGKAERIFQAPEPLVRALAVEVGGALYIANSPGGEVYRLAAEGTRAELWTRVEARYIWDLRCDEDGLWIATGSPAALYHLPKDAKIGDAPEKWGQLDDANANFTTLARDGQGVVWLGSSPDGVLYRVAKAGEGRAVYASPAAEINQVVPLDNGTVLFTTFAPGASRRSPSAPPSADPNSLPPIVVSADDQGSGGELWSISPDGFAQRIWRSSKASIQSLTALAPDFVLLGLADAARIVAFAQSDTWGLVHQVPQTGEVTRLVPNGSDSQTLVVTSRPAAIWRLGGTATAPAQLTAPVKDAGQRSLWSSIEVVRTQQLPLAVEVRLGETAKPDSTWTPWQPATLTEDHPQRGVWTLPESSTARFLQYRLRLTDPKARGEVERVRTYVSRPNEAPSLNGIEVLPFAIELQENVNRPTANTDFESLFTARGLENFLQAEAQVRYKVNRIDLPGWQSIVWRSTDTDNDLVLHDVWMRAVGDETWEPLATSLPQNYWSFPTAGLASGYYQVKVAARDITAQEAAPRPYLPPEAISRVFLIDNTPPTLHQVSREAEGGSVTLVIEAKDDWSPLVEGYTSLDGQPYLPITPDDLAFDGIRERFTFRLSDLPPGPHHLRIEVRDEAGQTGVLPLNFAVGEP